MVHGVAEPLARDASHSNITLEAESIQPSPQKVDPQVLKDLLREFNGMLSGFLLGIRLGKGVELLVPLI